MEKQPERRKRMPLFAHRKPNDGYLREKTMKATREIRAAFRPEDPKEPNTNHAVNVRPAGEAMEVVGDPAEIAAIGANDILIGTDQRGFRLYFFVHRNKESVAIAGYRENGTFIPADQHVASASAVNGMTSAGDLTVVATAEGLVYLHYTGGEYVCLGNGIELPVFSFGTTRAASASASLPEEVLKGSYSDWRGGLSADDSSRIAKNFQTALSAIEKAAARQCRLMRPVAVCAALRLWDDSLLWSPETAIVGSSGQPSALADAAIGGDGKWRVSETSLTLDTWKPAFSIAKRGIGAWRHLVKAVEIYTAMPRAETADVNIRCETSQQNATHSLRMMALTRPEEAVLRELAETTEFRLSASITDIDGFTDGDEPAGNGISATESAGVYAIDANPDGAKAEATTPPPAFVPAILERVGSEILAGDIKFTCPPPPHFLSLADNTVMEDGTAGTFVSVELDMPHGKAVVARSELTERYPSRLGRLATYPDSRARTLKIAVTAKGATRCATIRLTPSPSGCYAYAISPDGFPMEETDTLDIPETKNADFTDRTRVLSAVGGNPLLWSPCEQAASSGVNAIAPSLRYGSSWLLGRSPACLFSEDGIRLLSFDNSHHCTASTLISRRTASRRELVAVSADGLVFVDRNGELCRYFGSKVVATGVVVPHAASAGYSLRFDEAWVSDGQQVTVVTADNRVYHRPLVLSGLHGSMAVKGTSIRSIDSETERQTDVTLRTGQISTGGFRLWRVVWDTVADYADLRLSVYAENGRTCHGERISTLHASGILSAPLPQRIVATAARTFRLEMTGSLPSGTRIYPAVLKGKL